MKTSVCIATYNGDKFIDKQLESILEQLSEDDEVIIVDDCSTDTTVDVIRTFHDMRIQLFINGQNRGVNFSFERAISLTTGDIIFMADQDDIWTNGRVKMMKKALIDNKTLLVSCRFLCVDENENPISGVEIYLRAGDSERYFKNILDVFRGVPNYYGCVMAFKAELKNIILPFPRYIESHDLWIAMCANLKRSNTHIEDIVLLHRVHGNNASVVNRTLHQKIYSRWIFLRSILNISVKISKK